jgi:hypothetical protein
MGVASRGSKLDDHLQVVGVAASPASAFTLASALELTRPPHAATQPSATIGASRAKDIGERLRDSEDLG